MRKIYKKLTEDQLKRGVVFSSCLSEERTEQAEDNRHEVFKVNKVNKSDNKAVIEQHETIRRLKDDKFFNPSHWKYNIIRG